MEKVGIIYMQTMGWYYISTEHRIHPSRISTVASGGEGKSILDTAILMAATETIFPLPINYSFIVEG